MLRSALIGLTVLLVLSAMGTAQPEGAGINITPASPDTPQPTDGHMGLDVTDAPVIELARCVTRASGITVLATESTGRVGLKGDFPNVESVVRATAEAIDGSWLRTYVIEPVGQVPAEEETAADVLGRLQVAWRDWMLSRSDEELDAFRDRALAARGGAVTAPQPTATGGLMFDMVDVLQSPFHAEQVSLKLDAVEAPEALAQFTLGCGYITLLSPDVTGAVTLDVTEEELPKVLDVLCAQVNAQWRPLYILGKARDVPPDEMEQRFTQMLEQGAAEFWKQPPEDRARIIQRITDRMAQVPPDVRSAIKSSPWTSRIMGRAMQFVFTLTPDQRREIAPLLQSTAKLVGP